MEKVGDGEKWGNWKEVSNTAAVLAERDPWRLLTPLREACRGQHRKRVVGMLGHFPGMPLKTRARELDEQGLCPGPLGVSRCEEFRGGRGQVGRAQIRYTHTHTLDQVVQLLSRV